MPWGIAAGIVPKNAFSENRELQTFCQCFAFRISCFFQGKTGHKINIAVGVSNSHRRRFLFSSQQPVNGYIQDIRQGIQLNI